MGNIVSYLKWRGDLTFAERPFCNVDNLILCEIAYLDFNGIVPSVEEVGRISLSDALSLLDQSGDVKGVMLFPTDFYESLKRSRRFKDIQLSHFVDYVDYAKQTQFSALHFDLSDDTTYIAFRGTDDTIVGWKEDFSMSYQIMPSQEMAVSYLNETMRANHQYRIGGHSKGGNLALYGAINIQQDKQDRILHVYNNDGPGLCPQIVDMSEYQQIEPKLIRILPDFSLVGKLFELSPADYVVKSNVNGVAAHDGFSWQIEGDEFILSSQTSDAKVINEIFDTWLVRTTDMKQRETFVNDFFGSLQASGAIKMSEVTAHGIDGLESTLIALVRSESRTKVVIFKFIQSIFDTIRHIDIKEMIKTKDALVGAVLIVTGLFFVANPTLAAKCIAVLFGCGMLFVIGKRIINLSMVVDNDELPKKIKIALYILLMCVCVTLLNQLNFLIGFTQLIMSALFIYVFYRVVKYMLSHRISAPLLLFNLVICVVTFLLGIYPIVAQAFTVIYYTIAAGSFLILYGLYRVLKAAYQSGKINKTETNL